VKRSAFMLLSTRNSSSVITMTGGCGLRRGFDPSHVAETCQPSGPRHPLDDLMECLFPDFRIAAGKSDLGLCLKPRHRRSEFMHGEDCKIALAVASSCGIALRSEAVHAPRRSATRRNGARPAQTLHQINPASAGTISSAGSNSPVITSSTRPSRVWRLRPKRE
jgi:hypothetical protein